MMNRKILALFGVAVLVLLVARTHRPPPAPAPALPVSAGIWTADAQAGVYSEAGNYSGETLALVLPANTTQFQLDLSDGAARIPDAGATAFHVTFDDNSSFGFTGADGGGVARAPVGRGQIGPFTRHLLHGSSAVVTLDDDPGTAPWVFPLEGAAPTADALAANMRAAGLRGLPAPWNAAMLVQPAPVWSPNNAADDAADLFGISLSGFFFILAAMYFAPTIIAYARHSAHGGLVLFINVCLGWTVIGWFGALLLALLSPTRPQLVYPRVR